MRKDVRNALRGRSLSFLGANREIRHIEEHLHEGEEVHDLLACKFGDTQGRALLVVTDEKVLVFKDGWIFKNSQGMGYGDIRTIEVQTGLFWAKIKFKGEGMSFSISKVGRFAAEHGIKLIRSRIGSRYNIWETTRLQLRAEREGIKPLPPMPTSLPKSAQKAAPAFYETEEPLTLDQFLPPKAEEKKPEKSLVDELERLQLLQEKGVLTPEEYAVAKQRLLS